MIRVRKAAERGHVCPWCVGEVAKLWEWAANPHGALFTLLLRKSTESGAGDFHGLTCEENGSLIVGRWAGDRVVLCGDYDDSRLWNDLPRYRNVSRELVEAWNAFMGLPGRKLTYDPECSCNTHR
jgi:hypothetical protein